MTRKIFLAAVTVCLVVLSANICAAGTFQMIYNAENFTGNMSSNEAVDETFNTDYGKFRLQLRKLANASADKRIHVIIERDKERVYDEHFPKVLYGYTFRAFKNTVDNRQFYLIQSINRAIVIGWSPVNNKIETYIDSQNYYHAEHSAPNVVATKNGDLVMGFESPSLTASARYVFTWDAKKLWFAYADLGSFNYPVSRDSQ